LITEIEVKNFKTLRDVKIPLAPGITVMVGANNSGKSNALAVLKLLTQTERLDVDRSTKKGSRFQDAVDALGGPGSVYTRGGIGPLAVTVRASCEGELVERRYEDPREGKRPMGAREKEPIYLNVVVSPAPSQEKLSRFLKASAVHDLSVASLRAPSVVQPNVKLGPDGRDVAAVLDLLAGESPSLRDEIDAVVRNAAHDVKRVVTRLGSEPGTKVLGVEEKGGAVYGAEDMSDGLLLFIGMTVAAQLKLETPCVLALEEPERGIHPRRLRDLVDYMLRLTKAGVQVVLTTHSPTLLDEFRDTPESVLIFDRDEKGTHVTRLSDRPDWAKELAGAPLGELWYSGVLGGVPGR
jgi:predicted ATPase